MTVRDERYADRFAAGRRLGEELRAVGLGGDALVLGLPRGGVPVAFQVAQLLDAELDVLLVRKLGLPGRSELAMGAIASGGVSVINSDIVGRFGVTDDQVRQVAAAERTLLDARAVAYRGDRPAPVVEQRKVVVVDDGLATGATMRAAIGALRPQRPAAIVVAVPVASPESCAELEPLVDRVVCPLRPENFGAVSPWYDDFSETSDSQVHHLLHSPDPNRPR